ncbi:MAG: NAD-dependent epimerase/dehydratase family protein [Burkholderiales bacterium]|nr:NAD-dependent epimerase/dehydratase family protein [Burkholderiales bacterium]
MVVVTGASGFIGRACVTGLAAAGFRVRGLVRALDAQTAARAEFYPAGDLVTADDGALRNALAGATAVVHLAAQAHRPIASTDEAASALRRINVTAGERLARAAAGVGVTHFVFASSVKVNGEQSPPERPLRESDPPDPHDEYAASKWAAERVLAAVAEDTGLRVTALRLPLTYGPGAKANFASLAHAVRRGLPLPFASIRNRRSLLGTGNLCAALAALLRSDDRDDAGRLTPYFVADAQAVSTPDLVRAIARAQAVTARLWPLPPFALRLAAAAAGRSDAAERLLSTLEVDTAAFRTRFGWTPPRTLDEGLADALRSPPL